ncbi:SDR family oxidoreductase [Actinomadura spongiicola]|uniref:SDR family oxidoreductase n=1 Tax=Actinomadura spongiicola TaxID=2303421 RepID=A0A372GFY6_9ACTN|nr:SDR family NAD(P)-dependent oxidoreductase [Actinomadura spongiicola]RFS84305.1 SDR family oxidoreductase [Actinomadura spongiicola]
MSASAATPPLAVVTGAAGGVGRAVARRLAAAGMRLILCDRGDNVHDMARELAADGGAARGVRFDVRDEEAVEAAIADIGRREGPPAAVVVAHGIPGPTASVWECEPDHWRQVMDVNLTGAYLVCRSVLPLMLEQGYGRVVLIASMAGKEGNPYDSAYSASKAGVICLAKSLGRETATSGVLVNAVAPGVVDTPMLEHASEELLEYMTSRIPMGRIARPEEVAATVAWLCSPDCTFSTGAVFDLSGGRATY